MRILSSNGEGGRAEPRGRGCAHGGAAAAAAGWGGAWGARSGELQMRARGGNLMASNARKTPGTHIHTSSESPSDAPHADRSWSWKWETRSARSDRDYRERRSDRCGSKARMERAVARSPGGGGVRMGALPQRLRVGAARGGALLRKLQMKARGGNPMASTALKNSLNTPPHIT